MWLEARDRLRGETREGRAGARQRGSPHAGRHQRASPGPGQTRLSRRLAVALQTKESNVKYLYLLYADESKMPAPGSAQFNAQNGAFNNYFAELDAQRMFKPRHPLHPPQTSKT